MTASVADDKTEVTKWTYNTKIPSYGATGWWDKSAYKEGMVWEISGACSSTVS